MFRTISFSWLINSPVLVVLSLFTLPTQGASRLVWENNGHSYQRIENAVTWLEAKTYCQSQGGYLATITSEEENDFIFSQISGSYLLWLGGTDAGHEGIWKWVTNEPWIYSNWNTGEPNNYYGNEHYLHTEPNGKWNDQSEKSWHDINSYNKFWFVCEWESTNSSGNLTPYKISNWSDKIVVSNSAGTTTDSSNLYPSDTLYVSFSVINDGPIPVTGPFSVDLFVDNNKVKTFADWGVPALNANFYIYYRGWNIGSSTAGQHTIRIVADSTGVIAESNETDNQYSKVITVLGSASTDGPATTLITHYYQSIMERTPDTSGLSYWQGLVAEKQDKGEDVKDVFRQMADFFFNSSEYIGRNTTDRQFITNLYLTFFQREPDEGGYAFWLDQLAEGMTRNQAMSEFLYSQEFTDFMEQVLLGSDLIALINVYQMDKTNVQPYVFIAEESSLYIPYVNRDGDGAPTSTYGFKYISPDGEILHAFFDPVSNFPTVMYFTDSLGRVKVDVKNYDAATGIGDLLITYEDGTTETATSVQLDLLSTVVRFFSSSIEFSSITDCKNDDLDKYFDCVVEEIRKYADEHYKYAINLVTRVGNLFDRFRGRTGGILTFMRNTARILLDNVVREITKYESQQAVDTAVQNTDKLPSPVKEAYSTPVSDEICGDGIDNDRDGNIDEHCSVGFSVYLWDDQCPDDVIGLVVDGTNYGNTPEGKGREYNLSNLKPGSHSLTVMAVSSAGSRFGCSNEPIVSYGLDFLERRYSREISVGSTESYPFTLQ